MSRLPRALVAAAALGLAALPATATAASPAKPRQGPAGAAFYAGPAKLPGTRHGDLIWQRRLTGVPVVPGAASTRLVLYRGSRLGGGATPISGIVSVPRGKAPKGGWPVITWAHGTTGLADQCAPSRDASNQTGSTYTNALLSSWLKRGWAVVRTDYEGLGTPGVHPYLVGTSEGRAVLDVVRAARQLDSRLGRRIVISGHSQGGHAALWAAALEPAYTPELRLAGTAAFAPASHLAEQGEAVGGLTQPAGGLSALVAAIIRGADLASPGLDVASFTTPQFRSLYPQVDRQCLGKLAATSSFGGLAPAAMLTPGASLAPLLTVLGRNDPETLTIRTPVRVDQGSADTTVFPAFTDQLVPELSKRGSKVEYVTYPGVDHGGVVTAAADRATAWIAARLRAGTSSGAPAA